jgi:hypothetical protein
MSEGWRREGGQAQGVPQDTKVLLVLLNQGRDTAKINEDRQSR